MNGNDLDVAAKLAMRQNPMWYNCWGFTAWVFNWADHLVKFDCGLMTELLKAKTYKVVFPEVGDIIVYWTTIHGKRVLIHTGLVRDAENSIILHKPGKRDKLEYATEKDVTDRYYIADVIEFRRVFRPV